MKLWPPRAWDVMPHVTTGGVEGSQVAARVDDED